jgi:hypothetical protein
MTGFVPIMWAVWGVLVLIMLVLKIYTGRLAQNEDDQLVLDDAFENVRAEQAAIVAKVNKIQPIRRVSMWLAVAATVFVVCYYVWDIVNQFK